MSATAINYTAETTEALIAAYQAAHAERGNDCLVELAETFGKTVKSVRGKLIAEKVYVANPVANKTPKADTGPSKKDLLAELARVTGLNEEVVFNGLSGVRKEVLEQLIAVAA